VSLSSFWKISHVKTSLAGFQGKKFMTVFPFSTSTVVDWVTATGSYPEKKSFHLQKLQKLNFWGSQPTHAFSLTQGKNQWYI